MFHGVFERNMRRLGAPAFGCHYLEAVFAEFGAAARCYCALHSGQVIGGLVTLAFRDTVYVPWASALQEYFSVCPNNLLYWSAIRDACSEGLCWFDFGRSLRGSGPLRFKLQWGAAERVLHYQYLLPPDSALPGLCRQ